MHGALSSFVDIVIMEVFPRSFGKESTLSDTFLPPSSSQYTEQGAEKCLLQGTAWFRIRFSPKTTFATRV